MNTLSKLSALLLAMNIVACGGGSESNQESTDIDTSAAVTADNSGADTSTDTGSENASENGTDNNTDSNSDNTDVETQDPNDGVIADTFNFRVMVPVSLSVNVSAVSDTRSYVSLCHYKTSAMLELNYEDCVLRGSTSFGEFSGEFDAAPHFEQLGLAVWFIDTSIAPLTYQINRMEMDVGNIEIIEQG